MKVLHLIFTLETGGAENLLVDIVNEQCKKACVSLIVVNNKIDKFLVQRIDKSVRFHFLSRKEGSRSDLFFLLRLWHFLIKNKPDVIHCHEQGLIKLLPFWRKKAVITVHDTKLATKDVTKYCKVFTVSNAVKDEIFERYAIQSAVVYNGIRLNDFKKRASYGYYQQREFKILQISRLIHEKKGQHLAIASIKKLRDEGVTNIQLYFVGEGSSLEYLKAKSIELGVEPYVHFLNAKDRGWIQENLFRFDLLIQPSLYEGFGLTILEGIAAGLPVIASDIDGPAEILKGIPCGFLFRSGNADDLGSVIKKLFSLYNTNEVKALCNSSYSFVSDKFSINKTADEYLDHYQRLLN